MPFWFSLSAYQAWQRCEQRFEYSYVRRLRQQVKDVAPQKGTILHAYLASYYKGLQDGTKAAEAHWKALDTIHAYESQMKVAAETAFFVGDEASALEYTKMLPSLERIAHMYFEVRGQKDANRYKVLLVEERVQIELVTGINSTSIIDLVLEEPDRGLVWMTEHKSGKSVPTSAVRLRDLQTLLYTKVVDRLGIHPDGVLWNYLRTEEPAMPHQNKNGQFSRAVGLDTTWPIFEAAVKAAGQDPARYEEVRQRLLGREETSFFPRFEQVIVADPKILMEDYVAEATRARLATYQWKTGVSRPIRTLTRDCSFCPFIRLCETAITGGDEEDVIRMRFTTSREETPVP